jgi:hypothetical protein
MRMQPLHHFQVSIRCYQIHSAMGAALVSALIKPLNDFQVVVCRCLIHRCGSTARSSASLPGPVVPGERRSEELRIDEMKNIEEI